MRRIAALLPVLVAILVGACPASAWTWPANGPVLKRFSLGQDVYAAGAHRGIDVGAPAGSPVRAPASGSVSFAGTVPVGGRTVTIQTADGYAVTLVHLGTATVPKGGAVAEGDVVGTIGPSGEAEHDVPYVHLGIRIASEPEGYVDPLSFLPPRSAAAPASEAEATPPVAPGAQPASPVGQAPAASGEAASAPRAAPEPASPQAVPQSASPQGVADQTPAPGEAVGGEAANASSASSAPTAAGGRRNGAAAEVVPSRESPAAAPSATIAWESLSLAARARRGARDDRAVEETAPAAAASAAAAGVARAARSAEPRHARERSPDVARASVARAGAAAGEGPRHEAARPARGDGRRSRAAGLRIAFVMALLGPAACGAIAALLLRRRTRKARLERDQALRVQEPTTADRQETGERTLVAPPGQGLGRRRAPLRAAQPSCSREQRPTVSRLRRLPRAQAEAVAKERKARACGPLERPQDGEEARTPLVSLEKEARASQGARKLRLVPQPDVRLVPGEHEVPLLQPLDHMPWVRRVDRERAAGDEHARDLRDHLRERLILEVLDKVRRDGLVERGAREGELGDVRELEAEPRKERARRLERKRLGIHADDVAAERREKVGDGARGAAEVEHAVTAARLHEVAHRGEAKPRPRRLLEVRRGHPRHERLVVVGGSASEESELHCLSISKRT